MLREISERFRENARGTSMASNESSTSAASTRAFERLSKVTERTGLSRSAVYRKIVAGTFPPPVKLGQRASAWCTVEVDRWIADRISERDAKAAA
jgi:prophage regulatory protein